MSEYTAELYVHAIAIEREAAARYGELGEAMAGRGNHALAALFRMLATFEARHLEELKRRSAGIALPALEADFTWPETLPGQLDGSISPRSALAMALAAEKRARAFFQHAGRVCKDAESRELAREMAAEEAEHVALVERMLA
jgi:rubrerythrin